MKRILNPSILSADFCKLREQIDIIRGCGIQSLHFDVMDGCFVPEITFGTPVLKSIRDYTDMLIDVHMMVEEPERKIESFRKAGADRITVHAEVCRHLDRVVSQIRELGMKAGVALNPATPLCSLEEILPELDLVLIMTVNPGYGGQKYIPYCAEKVRRLREIADRRNPKLSIQVDGGINRETIRSALEAGADDIVSGSSLFNGDMQKNITDMIKIMEEYR